MGGAEEGCHIPRALCVCFFAFRGGVSPNFFSLQKERPGTFTPSLTTRLRFVHGFFATDAPRAKVRAARFVFYEFYSSFGSVGSIFSPSWY